MRSLYLGAAVAALAVAATPAAAADYLFTFAATGLSGAGTFTTASTAGAGGGFQITATSGTAFFGGSPFPFTGPTAAFGADNILFLTGAAFLSSAGTSATSTTGINVNFSYSGGSYRYTSDLASGVLTTFTVTPVVAAVPEPASWALMIGGLGLAGGTLRTRARRGMPAAA